METKKLNSKKTVNHANLPITADIKKLIATAVAQAVSNNVTDIAKGRTRLTKAERKRTRCAVIATKHASTTRKEPARATAAYNDHSLNLRCPKEGCNYLAKTTVDMLKNGRLRCPVHPQQILQTKEERGETRGRAHAA